jgi:hypothetical protein
MLMKSIAAGLAGTALFATVAFAQSPATTDKTPAAAATTTTTSAAGDWRTSKMDGLKVYNDANENIGTINDLLMDKSGNIKIAVIGVGGFLGMGEHLVAVPFDKLKFSTQAVAYTGSGSTNTMNKSTTTTGAATTDRPAATTNTTSSSSTSKWYPDHAVFNATKDELKAMPEFKYD